MAEMTVEQLIETAIQHEKAGDFDQARPLYEQLIARRPDSLAFLYRAALVDYRMGKIDSSLQLLTQALEKDPKRFDILYTIGVIHRNTGHLDEAVATLVRVTELKPDLAEAYNELGIALASQGRLNEAVFAFRKALSIRADFADALNNLGSALGTLGLNEEAGAAFRQAIAMRPGDAVAYNNLGHSLWTQAKYDDALTACERARFLNPNRADVHYNLGNVQRDLALHSQALDSYRKAVELRPQSPAYRSTLIGTYNYGVMDLTTMAAEMHRWNELFSAPLKSQIRPHENDRDPDRTLRIGYLSTDFCSHVSEYFIDPLLRNQDRQNFQIICYAQIPQPDESTKRFQSYADLWHFTHTMDDQTLADQIRKDKIDILVDLKLHTLGNRLPALAQRPAPIQISWLGYPGTSGLDTIDYRITDRFLEPPGAPPTVASASSERPIRLPDCFWCYDPMSTEPAVSQLPAKNAGFITFGSLNAFAKINDSLLELWAQTLAVVPSSRMIILAPPGSPRQRVLAKFRSTGVDPDRIEFVDRLPRQKYLRVFNRIDIALDTYPCSGHTTSLDSLWMGVPVVSLISPTVMGRPTYSQLSHLDLQHLATDDPKNFPKIAADLAADFPRLAELRASLRLRMRESPLMDGPRFARAMESIFRQIWKDYCRSSG
jgi:protein O-GlcNAc transferase